MQGGGDARNKLCAGGGAREIQLPRQQPVAMELIVRIVYIWSYIYIYMRTIYMELIVR